MRATQVMSRLVHTVAADASVYDAAQVLLNAGISAAPVVDADGRMIGIVSEADLMYRTEIGTVPGKSWLQRLVADDAMLARDYIRSHSHRVADVMTKEVVTADEATPLRDIAALMQRHRLKRAPHSARRQDRRHRQPRQSPAGPARARAIAFGGRRRRRNASYRGDGRTGAPRLGVEPADQCRGRERHRPPLGLCRQRYGRDAYRDRGGERSRCEACRESYGHPAARGAFRHLADKDGVRRWNELGMSAGSPSCARRMWRRSAARMPRWASSTPRLTAEGVKVPNGFALTAAAYRDALGRGRRLGATQVACLKDFGQHRRAAIGHECSTRRARSSMPRPARRRCVRAALPKPTESSRSNMARASPWPFAARPRPRTCRQRASPASTRASSTSAAPDDLFEACRRCFASVFTDRAIVYRNDNGFDHLKIGLSVGVMKMVRSDLAASGVDLHARHRIGLPRRRLGHGRRTASARTSCRARSIPTNSTSTSRPSGDGYRAVLRRSLGRKQQRMIYAAGSGDRSTANVETPVPTASATASPTTTCSSSPTTPSGSRSTTPAAPASGADGHRMGEGRAGWRALHRPGPAGDGGIAAACAGLRDLCAQGQREAVVTGRAVGEKIASGPVRIIGGARDLAAFQPGDVLVAETTSPDWEPVMKTGRRHRHQSRRPHLPCRDRGARARRAGGRRRRGCHGQARLGRHGHRVLRRGRDRPRLSGTAAVRDDDRRLGDAGPAAHCRSWSISAIRTSPSAPRCAPTTALASRAWNSSSASISASIRWRWCSRRRSHRPPIATPLPSAPSIMPRRPSSSSKRWPRASARSPPPSIPNRSSCGYRTSRPTNMPA